MAVYAYLRVSTDQQDVDNQRHGILDYCNTHQLSNIHLPALQHSLRRGHRVRSQEMARSQNR